LRRPAGFDFSMRLWTCLLLALIVSLGYGLIRMRETPAYLAAATIQLERSKISGNATGAADRTGVGLDACLRALKSDSMSARVAASFSQDELKILLRSALQAWHSGQPPPSVVENLGRVTVEPVARSYLIRIMVRHGDPEAAALVANRYADILMRDLTDNRPDTPRATGSAVQKMPVHLLDTAVPAPSPYFPNERMILRSAIALGMLTFVAFAIGLRFFDRLNWSRN